MKPWSTCGTGAATGEGRRTEEAVFIDRSPRGKDPWLNFKVGAFVAGAGIAGAGIYFGIRWLIWVAIAVLLLGYAVRFVDRGSGES